jgi:carbon-monoxide dehydrogenase iron sulfur subunit
LEEEGRIIKRRVPRPLLVVDPKKCTGCRYCQLICSYCHDKVFSPARARIEVVRIESPALDYALACRHCYDAPCAKSCPVEAIRRAHGIVIVDKEKCIGCGECVKACPFGAMKLHPDTGKAINCDLCGLCVKYCPPVALKIVDINDVAIEKNFSEAEKLAKLYPKAIVG